MNKKTNPQGRPTKYLPEYDDQVVKLCKLGATDKEIADFFGVAESTLNLWKLNEPSFSESIKKGKIVADANVADRLYQRACGYEHDDEELKVVSLGGNMGSEVQRCPIKKYYPPDTAAAFIWMKNRRGWKDKVDITTKDESLNKAAKIEDLSDEALKKVSDAILAIRN